jgi:Flp pilus assembly pilin Flp
MWTRLRTQRGATAIEVALIIALIATVTIGADRLLGTNSSKKLGKASDGVSGSTATTISGGGGDDGGGGGGTGGGGGGTGDGGGGTGGGSQSTTTVVGAGGSTTTTTGTTSTTTEPVSRTTVPAVAAAQFSQANASRSGTHWSASAQLLLHDQTGAPLAGATVTIAVEVYTENSRGIGTWSTTTVTLVTAADGTALLSSGPYSASKVSTIEYAVTTVDDGSQGATWDGASTTVQINAP